MDVIAQSQRVHEKPPLPSEASANARPAAKSWPYVSGPGFQEAVELPPESDRSFMSFLGDLVDVINPLQHIPLVSTAYRAITGDTIRPEAQIAGDVLFGGPIGLVASLANQVVAHETGRDISEHVLALFDSGSPEASVQTAQASPAKEDTLTFAEDSPAPAAAPAQIAQAELPPAPAQETLKSITPPPGAMRPPELTVFSESPKPPQDAILPMASAKGPDLSAEQARFMPIDRAVIPKSSRLTSKSVPMGPAAQQIEGNPDARRALLSQAQQPPAPTEKIATEGTPTEGIIAGGGFVPLPAQSLKQTPTQSPANENGAARAPASQASAHPLLPPEAAGREGEWIANRMAEALDKYQRNARMAKEAL